MIPQAARARLAALAIASLALPVSSANADILLSQLIVELQPGVHAREDIEILNNGTERSYVAVVPGEIVNPGRPDQSRREDPDPEKLGLLAAPARLILEPGQRKLLRIGTLASTAASERDYRVTVKPVAGPLTSKESGLKVLVGYDVLVLVRPSVVREHLTGERTGKELAIHNDGNVSVELTDGRQCDGSGQHCVAVPGKRVYAGADWKQALKTDSPVSYLVRSPGKTVRMTF
jgi:P pilus assembly chaperone PapD